MSAATRRRTARRHAASAAACLLASAFTASEAAAHDYWARGQPISEWVKRQCCGPADAHHLQPSQVHVTSLGYRIDGYAQLIPEQRLMQSPDGEWWVFYRDLDSGVQSEVYCFFGPPQGS